MVGVFLPSLIWLVTQVFIYPEIVLGDIIFQEASLIR
jgi:hypothetical protein